VIAALALPLIAVCIGQLLRWELYPPNFDAPLRLALCIPIFMALRRGWLASKNPAEPSLTVQWTLTMLPIAMLVTLPFFHFTSSAFGNQRGTYFVDPLTFGSYTLLFSLLSLAALTHFWQDISTPRRLLSVLGIIVGLYMSVTTHSRSGWINLPVFLLLWTVLLLKPKWGLAKSLMPLAGILVLTCLFLWIKPALLERFSLAIQELMSYRWDEMNPDTSVGMRIAFYRFAYFYFLQSPIAGWGDLGWMKLMNSPELMVYASEFARDFAKNGFHNEIVTSTIRSGIWGLGASVLFFAVPVYRAVRGLNVHDHTTKYHSFVILVFIIHLFATGMTTEVTNLVFLCSFIGLGLSTMLSDQVRHMRL
jgi:O-antigen ligase